MQKQKPLLQRLFCFAGSAKNFTVIGMVLSGVSAVISLLPIIFIWFAISEVITSFPKIALTQGVIQNALLAVISAISSILIYTIALMFTHLSAFKIAKNMRKDTIKHLMKLPLGFFNSTQSGKLRKVVNDSAGATESYLAHQLPDIVGAFVTPICVVIILFVFDWKLGLISFIPLICAFTCMSFMMDKEQPVRLKQYQSALEDMNSEATEYVRGIPVVKTFNQSVFSFERFHNVITKYKDYVSAYSLRARYPMVMFQTFLASTPFFLVISSIFLISGHTDAQGFFLNFLFYLLFTPICSLMLMRIMWITQYSMLATDAVNRIEELLAAEPLAQPNSPKTPENFDIKFFTYPNTDKKAIDGVSLEIKQGKTFAFVGPSGGGKSTLATLIPRFWDTDEGVVSIGGVDVRDIEEDVLMQNISFVFQSTNLYKASILDNLKEGKPNATLDEIHKALKAARCEDIIAKLPNGINTIYGTKGVYLSGGEAQRIALARAILKDAPIILLDEATAFTDPENEHQIQLAFNELTKGKTVLMIAHRLTTIKNADMIYVVDGGKIIESGTHDQLLANSGLYSDMWSEYNNTFMWSEVDA